MFLPVAQPELNPIEMVWSRIKRIVAAKNLAFRLTDVENKTREQIDAVTPEQFLKYARHAQWEEGKYRNMSHNSIDKE